MQHTSTPTKVGKEEEAGCFFVIGTLVGKQQGLFKSAHSQLENFQDKGRL